MGTPFDFIMISSAFFVMLTLGIETAAGIAFIIGASLWFPCALAALDALIKSVANINIFFMYDPCALRFVVSFIYSHKTRRKGIS